jgi:hypothetical protein
MKIRNLTIATVFVASLAWTGVAKAEDPCGAPSELLESCEVVERPECNQVCEPDAMLVSCMADASASCMIECEDADSVECEAGCAGACEAKCTKKIVPEQPEECEIECGADCMGGCAASCDKSGDKTTCFAACNQQCSAHCSVSCEGGGGPDEDYECKVECAQACTGTCKAEAARDCEIACQSDASAKCKAELVERCKEKCDEGGILTCDEQYIDIDDVDACLAELEQQGIDVRGSVQALLGGTETVLKPRGASCSVEDQAKLGLAGALFTLLSFGLGATFLRRRR